MIALDCMASKSIFAKAGNEIEFLLKLFLGFFLANDSRFETLSIEFDDNEDNDCDLKIHKKYINTV